MCTPQVGNAFGKTVVGRVYNPFAVEEPKMPVDNTADIARAEEEKRQGRINESIANIDNSFTGFNQPFYDKYQADYTGYYQPQLDDQYADARKRLTLQLAKTGNLTSSAGINQLGDLQENYNTQRTGITNQAIDAVNRLKGDVDMRKSQLYTDARSAADPGSATSAATSAAAALQPGMPASPLANSFADFFKNLGNSVAIANSGSGQQNGVQSFGGAGKKSYQNFG